MPNGNPPFQQGQLQPEFNWGSLINVITPIVTGVLSSLSTSPQLSQLMRPQAAGPGQIQPQASGPGQLQPEFNWGSLIHVITPIVTGVLSSLSASPQLSQAMQPQAASALYH